MIKPKKSLASAEQQNKIIKKLKEKLKFYTRNKKVLGIFATGSIARKELGSYKGYKRDYSDIDLFMIIKGKSDLKTNIKLQKELWLKYGNVYDMYKVLDKNGKHIKILGKYPAYAFAVTEKKLKEYESGKFDIKEFSFKNYKKKLVKIVDLGLKK